MKVLTDKLTIRDSIVEDPQGFDRSQLSNALKQMKYDILTVKNAWDLKSIWNDTFAPVITPIKIMELSTESVTRQDFLEWLVMK